MMSSAAMNEILAKVYTQALSSLEMRFPNGASRPLLIKVPAQYDIAAVKLMVVGQQTAGWAEDQPLSADALMRAYEEWDLAAHYKPTQFWDAAHQMNLRLNAGGRRGGFLWTNLVKLDTAQRRPNPEIEDAISSLKFLPSELRVTKPEVVIFFTGPNYDNRLLATFQGAKLEQCLPEYDVRRCAQVVHDELPLATFRTYHPRFLRTRKMWNLVHQIADMSIAHLQRLRSVPDNIEPRLEPEHSSGHAQQGAQNASCTRYGTAGGG